MRKNKRAAPAARLLVHFFDISAKRRREIVKFAVLTTTRARRSKFFILCLYMKSFRANQAKVHFVNLNLESYERSWIFPCTSLHFASLFFLRLRQMVKSYIEDADPEAVLSVGADMRKINYCFQLLKVKHVSFFTFPPPYALILY